MSEATETPALKPIHFGALAGWADEDHAAALAAFRRGAAALAEHPIEAARPRHRRRARSARLSARPPASPATSRAAPRAPSSKRSSRLTKSCPPPGSGFFTGYYEPIVEGSRVPTERFNVPLYARPRRPRRGRSRPARSAPRPVLSLRPAHAAGLAPYVDRAAIEAGASHGPRPGARLARRSGRCLLHPHPGRRAHRASRRRHDAGHLCRQDRPPLHADRQRAGRSRARSRSPKRRWRGSAPGSPRIPTRQPA